jgi:hypothetical protein
MAQIPFDVYLNGKKIDTVFYNEFCYGGAAETAEDVKKSLIDHDGYDSRIEVRKRREKLPPPYRA